MVIFVAIVALAAFGGVDACQGTPKIVSVSMASAKPINLSYAYTKVRKGQACQLRSSGVAASPLPVW